VGERNMKRKTTVTYKDGKIETHDNLMIYVWDNWIEVKPKGKDCVLIERKKGTRITIK
jgi:hypothetical protein